MTSSVTTKPFERLAIQSGLLTPETLHALHVRFPTETAAADDLANLLLRERLLTSWQVQKLKLGKHRGFFLGPYKLQSHLARGGMSTLYVAEHVQTQQKRALKVLSPVKAGQASYLPRFIREAKLASQLRHDNIVRVFDLMKVSDGTSDIHFMVMELLDGSDLFNKVTNDGPTPVREAVQLICQAAAGLGHSHRRGLVHRDVKPGNLFLTRQGNVKVVDLGLATLVENQDESLTRDCNERVLGTADYLAPEQAIDSHRADSRADIYALGCTFYFLLTGRPPFNEGSLAQRILAHQSKDPVDVRTLRTDVPDDLAEVLSAMLVKRRARRIQTCEEVEVKLSAWLETHSDQNQFDQPSPAVSPLDANEPLVGRKLQRVKPARRAVPTETPTDTIRAAETQTGPGNKLEETIAESQLAESPYCEQFESFLENLDEQTGVLSVMSSEARLQKRRELSHRLVESPTDYAASIPDNPALTTAKPPKRLPEWLVNADNRFYGRGLLAVCAVLSAITIIGFHEESWLQQLYHLLLNSW